MIDWLIKLLRGYTEKEFKASECAHFLAFSERAAIWSAEKLYLEDQIRQARKNDHRDSKGRFTKGKDNA